MRFEFIQIAHTTEICENLWLKFRLHMNGGWLLRKKSVLAFFSLLNTGCFNQISPSYLLILIETLGKFSWCTLYTIYVKNVYPVDITRTLYPVFFTDRWRSNSFDIDCNSTFYKKIPGISKTHVVDMGSNYKGWNKNVWY